ncbi:MAG: hypothetical protein QXZ17_05625 [Nitrososphaerota archaeon]
MMLDPELLSKLRELFKITALSDGWYEEIAKTLEAILEKCNEREKEVIIASMNGYVVKFKELPEKVREHDEEAIKMVRALTI